MWQPWRRCFTIRLQPVVWRWPRRAGLKTVVLGGGCFQNRLLAERMTQFLMNNGFRVLASHRVPPGDGGLAVGQIWAATLRIASGETAV